MYEQFTVEEINLMCIFDTASRSRLIENLTAAIPDFEDNEMTEIADGALKKLIHMDDDEFNALDLYPVYEDYDEKED